MSSSQKLDKFIAALSTLDAEHMGTMMDKETVSFFDGKKFKGKIGTEILIGQFAVIIDRADRFVLEIVMVDSLDRHMREQIVSFMKLTLYQGDDEDVIHFLINVIFSKDIVDSLMMNRTYPPALFVDIFTTSGESIQVPIDQVFYLKKEGHKILWFTEDGLYEEWGSFSERLPGLPENIHRIGKGHAINLRRADKVERGYVYLPGSAIKIPHGKVKFFRALIEGYKKR